MKTTTLLITILLSIVFLSELPAQDESFDRSDYPTEFNQKKGDYLSYYTERSDIFTEMSEAELILDQVLFGESIAIRSATLSGTMTVTERVQRRKGVMSIFGYFDGQPDWTAQITQNDGFIHAYIFKGTQLYRIETLDGNNYIFKVNQSVVPPEGCFDIPQGSSVAKTSKNQPSFGSSRINYSCKIRVLVLYTTAYSTATADPRGSIQGYMDYTNNSNNLSGISVDFELCYIEETAYTETNNMYTDRDRFQADNDGFMDEVHDLRFKYEADYCHLMTNKAGHTGVAYSINSTSSSQAFCLTNKGNAESIFTFAHEMGHLTGCRHDPYVDGTNTPYAYQHGYIYYISPSSSNDWRTIMAYNTECSDNGGSCPRILRWSNPGVNYNGGAGSVPTGTVSGHDNARVHDNEDQDKIAFNQADPSETLFDADVDQANYGYVTATDFIQTSGTVTIEGDDFDMIATNQIILGNGFTVQNGTELFMDTQTVGSCP